MKLFIFFSSCFTIVAFAQSTGAATAQGTCNAVNTGNGTTVNQTCYGIDKKLADQIGQLAVASKRNAKALQDLTDKIDKLLKEAGQVNIDITQHSEGANSPNIVGNNNTVITQDADTIRSLQFRAELDLPTPTSAPTEQTSDFGIASVMGVFDSSRTLYRFETEYSWENWQVSSQLHRLAFLYHPESPDQLVGRPIGLLAKIERLGVNYKEFLFPPIQLRDSDGQPTLSLGGFQLSDGEGRLKIIVILNGIEVATLRLAGPTDSFRSGQLTFDVSAEFLKIPEAYKAKLVTRARQQE